MTICIVCKKDAPVVHRTKPKGQPDAGWTCTSCMDSQGRAVDPEVRQITDIISASREDN